MRVGSRDARAPALLPLFLLAALAPAPAAAATLATGDLLSFDATALRRVTGVLRSDDVLSGRAISFLAPGASPTYPVRGHVAVEPDGHVLFVDGRHDALVELDPATKAWRVVAGDGVGTGPALSPGDPVVEPGGTVLLIVPGAGAPAILRIDPTTGDRTVFLRAPIPPSEPGMFSEYDPQALAVRSIPPRATGRSSPIRRRRLRRSPSR
jgi:streptogramin lyase